MNPLLAEFITESRDLLEQASQGFLALEKAPGDAEILNGLFRAMHTMKGASGCFEIGALTRLVHAAEDVLDAVRQGELNLTPDRVDLFFEVLDRVGEWVDSLEAEERLPPGAEETSAGLAGRLRGLLSEANDEEPAGAGDAVAEERGAADVGSVSETSGAAPSWIVEVPDDVRRELYQIHIEGGPGTVAVTYTPGEQCFFTGDDPFHTARQTPGARWGRVESREPWPPADELDPYRCVLRFHLVAAAPVEEVREWFRYVADQVEVHEVAPEEWVIPAGPPGHGEPFGAFGEDARRWARKGLWGNLRDSVRAALEMAGPDLFQTSALHWMDLVLRGPDPDPGLVEWLIECVATGTLPPRRPASGAERSDEAKADHEKDVGSSEEKGTGRPEDEALAAAVEILQAQTELLAAPWGPDIRLGVLESAAGVMESALTELGDAAEMARLAEAREAAQTQGSGAPLRALARDILSRLLGTEEVQHEEPEEDPSPHSGGPAPSRSPRENGATPGQKIRVLKVDQTRIDALMDLVGELVVAKNALPFLARKAEEVFRVRDLAREIKNQHAVINRIAEELQGAVMQVRMVPVSHAFQRFPRLVRDLSRKLGKKVRLVMEGEETEADKNVVEDLAEPLVHLVRNSIDHGIESPEEREAAGKPLEGEIRLRAVQLDDQVWIEVIDDGRGMDPEVLKRKAYEKGILSEERLETITDEEALHLIFAPGFSTAEQVSDVSGRGVGMDAVRAMVDRVGGSVSVESTLGRGTCIRMALPLSMAVTRVMIVEVGGETLGVPIENIVETVRVPTDEIHRIKRHEAAVLRDRLVPLCRLGRVLDLEEAEPEPREEEAVLVVSIDGRELGLVVDRFHEGVDIILKPLEGIMAGFRLYAGTALLGDGRVLLVLNLRELVACL
ncbi:MAG: chemotaxis protein CheA [Deltaproteobacteria bacterium]|nr:chemotaxis protein CheA [Deltaproteobacteria bacterium]